MELLDKIDARAGRSYETVFENRDLNDVYNDDYAIKESSKKEQHRSATKYKPMSIIKKSTKYADA